MDPNIRAAIDGALHITVPDINTADNTYNYVLVYEDTSSAGAFGTATGNVALEANTTGYIVYDQNGTSSVYYKACLADDTSGTTKSGYSSVRQGGTQAAYCTALDVRGELGMGARTNVDAKSDHWLWERAVQASHLIDNYCGCPETADLAYLATTADTFTFSADGSDWLWLPTPMTSLR